MRAISKSRVREMVAILPAYEAETLRSNRDSTTTWQGAQNKRRHLDCRRSRVGVPRRGISMDAAKPQRRMAVVADRPLVTSYDPWGNPGQAGSQEAYLPCDRCRDGPGLNLCTTRFFRRIQQKLAAAKINGSRPFAHAKNRLLAKACDRLILESQLTPGLDTGLHGRTLVNIIVHCSRTR